MKKGFRKSSASYYSFEQECFLRMLQTMEPSKSQLNLDLDHDKSRLEKLMENTYLLKKTKQPPPVYKRSRLSWHLHDEVASTTKAKPRPSMAASNGTTIKRSNSADASKKASAAAVITCDVANLATTADLSKLEVVGTNPRSIGSKNVDCCKQPVIKRSIRKTTSSAIVVQESKPKCKIVRSRQILKELQRQVKSFFLST